MTRLFRFLAQPRAATWIQVAVLVALTTVKGLFWIGMTPALLVADEPAHFDNVQFRAEHHGPPRYNGSGKKIDKVISPGAAPEVLEFWRKTIPKNYYNKGHHRDHLDETLEKLAQSPVNRDNDGQTTSIDYPGLYYQLGVPFYDAFKTSPVTTRIYAVRVLSLLFLLVATLATYFAGRLLHDEPALAFAAAAMVTLQPMASQQGASVNNDAGIIGVSALVFYFQLRTLAQLPKMPSVGTLVGLVLSTLAIFVTKPNGYGIVPGTVVVLLIAAWTQRRRRWVQVATALAFVGGIAGLLAAPHLGINLAAMVPGDTSAPGQFGSPSFVAFFDTIDDRFHDYLVRSSWGQFGWLDFSVQHSWVGRLRWAQDLFELGSIVVLVTFVLRPLDRPLWFRFGLWAFSALTLLGGVLFILFVEHRFRLVGLLGVIQGRNFLYVLPAFALWASVALGATLPRPMRGFAAATLFTGALVFHVVAVLTIVGHHYAH